jgi:hypothetical protein
MLFFFGACSKRSDHVDATGDERRIMKLKLVIKTIGAFHACSFLQIQQSDQSQKKGDSYCLQILSDSSLSTYNLLHIYET